MSDFKIVEEMEITGALGSRPIPQLVEIVYEVTRGTVKVQSVWGWSGEYFEVPIGRDEYDTVKAHQLAASDWAARCESTQSWFEDMAAEAAEAAREERKLRLAEIAKAEQELELQTREAQRR